MSSLFRRHLVGTRHSQISSGPQADIFRHGISGTGHEVSDALQAGEFHLISYFLVILILFNLLRSMAGKETIHHKLQKSILCG